MSALIAEEQRRLITSFKGTATPWQFASEQRFSYASEASKHVVPASNASDYPGSTSPGVNDFAGCTRCVAMTRHCVSTRMRSRATRHTRRRA
jgi:hypothetical protein